MVGCLRQSLDHRSGLSTNGILPLSLLPAAAAIDRIRNDGAALIAHALRTYRQMLHPRWLRPHALHSLLVRGILTTADHRASAGLAAAPVLPARDYTWLVDQIATLRGHPMSLYDHQTRSAQTRGNVVLIAPTGSGKTEAALCWAFGMPAQPVPRLFYALPFQASMNAMYTRLTSYIPDSVGLQHGRALQALYRLFMETDGSSLGAWQQARDQHERTALNYFPVRVCSPYQLLKAVYRLRGYEALLSDCIGGAFILDEIHAYEPARLALILRLVAYLRAQYHARFFVMSATFPRLIHTVLYDALGSATAIRATDDLFQAFQRHRLRLMDGALEHPTIFCQIVARAQSGESVLVCCNTVGRAQMLWQMLRQELGAAATVELLHSRLNGRDRLAREERVQRLCGLNSMARAPIVVVATQVVEVSLNIDLDTIFTDPAPLEALIQRFGRVNRNRRLPLTDVHVCREPIPEQNLRPYDTRLLHGTLAVLEPQQGQPIDEAAVSDWLDALY
ncbi:MAG: CRISPR-associated helicase Cas3', partial [Chloroflexaceae bacterium]|nr:CRISPR-associated helicase Cas3' [Chloroflexaceae bacterium]